MVLLAHAGHAPSRGQVRSAASVTLIAVLAITGVRTEQGRTLYHEDNGLGARSAALGRGLTAAKSGGSGQSILAQAAYRLDGTDFAGAILQAESLGHPKLSAAYVPESLLLDVPSALWPSKLNHGDISNPILGSQIENFGLQNINFLPTLPGLYIGFLATPWLISFLALLGLLAGYSERWLFRHHTPARLVLLAGTISAALVYEQGLPGMVLTLRSAATIAIIVKSIEAIRVRRCRTRAASLSVS